MFIIFFSTSRPEVEIKEKDETYRNEKTDKCFMHRNNYPSS